MPRIATRHAHKLAYRRRFSLGVRMIGCLILLAGAIVLAAALAELVKASTSPSLYLMTALGVVLFVVGATLFCGERGKLIDRQGRVLKCWWGAILPLRRTYYDLQPYQAVGIQPLAEAGTNRWRVCLWNGQGERLDLFDLPTAETAELAARQIGMFLSLALAPPPAAVPAGQEQAPPASPPEIAPLQSGDRWTYREPFALPWRGLGVVLLVLSSVLLLALLTAPGASGIDWRRGAMVLLPLGSVGLWLSFGGHKVLVMRDEQTVKLWRAWPLPPAAYDLAAFYAVVVARASEVSTGEQAEHLVGLMGADQLRLEVIHGLPHEEAHALASELAAAARLPLVEG
ncbi:MAG TPA: hypothetical protein VFI31_07315 [Pirellulales bacterium]|nr:hypothetical protein [Pirellulales bacterium]